MHQEKSLYYDSDNVKSGIFTELKTLWNSRYLVKLMVSENLSTRYRYSVLGVFWTLLEPLATMIIMALVFTYILPRLENFSAYLISGLSIWTFFSVATNQSFMAMFMGNVFAQNINVPKSVFLFSTAISRFVDLSIAIIISILISLISGIEMYWGQLLIFVPLSMVFSFLFSLGISFLVSSINVFFNDMEQIYKLILPLVMYLSAIFYFPDFLPKPLSNIVLVNPVYQIIYTFRTAVYYAEWPNPYYILYAAAVSIGVFILGLFVYSKLEKYFIYYS